MTRRIYGKCRCCECGHIFDEDELIAQEEDMGEYWGRPCTQTWYYSPCCMWDYENVYEEPEEEEYD